MIVLTSCENEKVKMYIKLKKKKYRDLSGEYIVEGMHSVMEAFKTGMLEELILEENEILPLPCKYVYVSHDIMKKISTVDTPPTIMGLCKKRILNDNKFLGKKILVLDQLQDPGNLGTIIRSACAFGVDSIVLSENTVDLYNPKVIRGTQGMIFHMNIFQKKSSEIIELLKSLNIPVYGTKVEYGSDVRSLNEKDKRSFALVVGNEGNGVRSEISDMCDKNLYINMNDRVESLNVAIATSILLYELGR